MNIKLIVYSLLLPTIIPHLHHISIRNLLKSYPSTRNECNHDEKGTITTRVGISPINKITIKNYCQ